MDKWIDGFEMGMCCYDKKQKEYVHVSNGLCTLDHSSPEAFKTAHNGGGCIYKPSEAIVLRVVGVTKTKDPVIAFTYRRVDVNDLEPSKPKHDPTKYFDMVRPSRFIGRV